MSFTSKVETIEKNKVKITIEVSPVEFKKGLQFAYNRNKKDINVQGFRKGKAPRKIIEQYYGKEIFYEEAINHVLPDVYEGAIDEHKLEPVYRPEIDVESMSENEGAVVTAEVFVKPEVEIEGYHGLTYPIVDSNPTEEDIQNRLQSERERNARTITVDRPAEIGDIVTINFTGYVDGEPFEGGHAENYEITLGSKTFIDTFEDQIVGHSVGDDIDVNVTFPEEYGQESLQNKPALFKVEVLEIQTKELPELNDEFAQDVSEFDSLEALRADYKEKIREEKEQQVLASKRANILQQLVEKAVMEIPEVMYTARVEEMTEEMRFRLWQQGLTLEQYFSFTGMTLEAIQDNYLPMATDDVKARLVLSALAEKESFEVSEEEILEHIKKTAAPDQDAEKIVAELRENTRKGLIEDLKNQKALDFVIEKAVAIEEVLN